MHIINLNRKILQNNFLQVVNKRFKHGYVVQHFQSTSGIKTVLNELRCGLVFGMYIYFRLETLSRFRRLRRVDMYRRRSEETRELIFVMGTLLSLTKSTREDETGVRIVYMDKWFNRFQFDFRSSAINFLGIARWDLRSFFRPYKFFLGRKNAHNKWLSESLKKRPGRWLL